MNREALEAHLKKYVLKKAKKVKAKHSNISEIVNKMPKTLEVNNIYDLSKEFNNFYLIKVQNHAKRPKMRYFLAISLASQSSDLLVNLTRDLINKEDNIRLIQFSIHPKSMRVNLLALKELTSVEKYLHSIEILNELRKKFRQKLAKIANQVENE